MRRTILPATLLALGLTLATLPAADPSPNAIARLVGDLGSQDFHTREAATKELEALGEPALAAVRRAEKSEDLEVARRAAGIAAKIALRVETDRILTPTMAELNVKDTPLLEALAELQKQTGFKIGVTGSGAADVKVTLNSGGKQPFWTVIEKLCTASELELVPDVAALKTGITYPGGTTTAALPAAPADPAGALMQDLERIQRERIEAMQQLLKARQAQANAKGEEEKKKLDEAMKKQQQEMARVIQLLAQAQAQQQLIAAERGRLRPPAYPAGPVNTTIVLRPRSGKPSSPHVNGGVRIEAVPFPTAALASLQENAIPVVLSVMPEPTKKWGRVEAVRITKAVDDAGAELATLPSKQWPSQLPQVPVFLGNGRVVLNGGGQVDIYPNGGQPAVGTFQPTANQALTLLTSKRTDLRTLKLLEGTVSLTYRTDVRGLEQKLGDGTAQGDDVVMKVSKMTPTATDGEFQFDVTVSYDPAKVQPEGGPGNGTEETIMIQNGGRVVIRRQVGGMVVVNGQRIESVGSANGLKVLDTSGNPVPIVASQSSSIVDGSRRVTETRKLTVKATPDAAPSKVVFAGTQTRMVEVPFRLSDLVVSSGTAPAAERETNK